MTDKPSTPRRYLALWFPFLPTDRLRRTRHPGAGPPDARLVVVEPVKGALRLRAASREALQARLMPGMTLADARARVPDLLAVEHDGAADAALLDRLADDCDRVTPLVALDGEDGLLLDITGCAHLGGGEAPLRERLLARLGRWGLQARATIAGTPDAARALAHYGRVPIVPPGGDRAAVRALPIAALDLPDETRIALRRAGLKRLGDLDDRPSQPLAARFGRDLPHRLRAVLGDEDRRITPRRPPPACIVEQAFPEPVAHGDDIAGTLERLVGRAGDLLEARGEGGRRFEASFFRADGAVRRVAVGTGRPSRDARAVLRLFRERLDALADPLDPGFGYDLIRLAVPVAEPLGTAQASLDGRTDEDEAVAVLVDRLVARFGRTRVLRFAACDTHDPGRAAGLVPATAPREGGTPWPGSEPDEPPLRPLQLFDPPQAIEAMAEIPDGPPRRFRWRRVVHDVARAEGPERIAAEWWRDGDAPTRDYYRVEDAQGRRFWLFRAGLYGRETAEPRWYLHGLFA